MNIPNIITMGRILAVPVIFWLLVNNETAIAFFVFVAAGVSDAVDGYLAKSFNWQTELGAYLDPLADKLLIVSIFVALEASGHLPSWLVIAVVSRDVMIVLGVLLAWLLNNPLTIHPFIVSKANTAAQLLLASLVLADEAFQLGLTDFRFVMVWITGVLTTLSLGAYMVAWLRHMTGAETADSERREKGEV